MSDQEAIASIKASAQKLSDSLSELEQLAEAGFSLSQEDREALERVREKGLEELRFRIYHGHQSCPTCGTHFAVEGQRP